MYGTYGTARSQARMTGLMSGLDTEELVKGMTASVSAKITGSLQQKQSLQWKMEAYQSISGKMLEFNNKYFSPTSSLNILNKNFYKAASAKATGGNAGAVTVSGSSKTAGSLKLTNIVSKASTAGFVTTKAVSGRLLSTGDVTFGDTGRTHNNLAGQTINIEYGGKQHAVTIASDFTGTGNGDIAAAVNAALGNVKLDENGTETLLDKVSMQGDAGGLSFNVNDPADGNELKVIGGSGKSLKALGITVGDSNEDGAITGGVTSDITSQIYASDAAGKNMTFELNGIRKTVTIGAVADNSREALQDAMQEAFDGAFGENRVRVGTDGDKLTFEAVRSSGGQVISDDTAVMNFINADSALLGKGGVFNGGANQSNRLIQGDSIRDIKFQTPLSGAVNGNYTLSINGKDFTFGETESLSSILDTVNKSDAGVKIEYMSTTDTFNVTASESGAHGRVEISDVAGNLASTLFGAAGVDYQVDGGTDAEIVIEQGGKTSTLVRSTNSFDIDGMTVTLNPGAGFDPAKGPVAFESQTNADDLIKNIKTMVDEMNSLIGLVNGELNTKPDRDYYPLTTEMKDEMSDNEIETWEKKANSGMLFNDPDIRSLASDMRFLFSFGVTGVGNASDFGITTSSAYADNGKISVDEEKLRKAIEENPDGVTQLFINPKTGDDSSSAGLMNRVKTMMDKYVATTGQHKGVFINMVGEAGKISAANSSMQKKIDGLDDVIEKLEKTKKAQEERYYKQFSSLETYLARMQMQSSWFSSQG